VSLVPGPCQVIDTIPDRVDEVCLIALLGLADVQLADAVAERLPAGGRADFHHRAHQVHRGLGISDGVIEPIGSAEPENPDLGFPCELAQCYQPRRRLLQRHLRRSDAARLVHGDEDVNG